MTRALSTVDGAMKARVEDTSDGHGAQFKIHLEGGATKIPPQMLAAIVGEATTGGALYVDGVAVAGDDLVISLCHGKLVMAKVDAHWNPRRRDEKFRVILREDRDEGDRPQEATPALRSQQQ
ncbi:MAG: hypothetical protein Q8R35_01930 [bacterium]|nr:hypothetical protein [bacterium]